MCNVSARTLAQCGRHIRGTARTSAAVRHSQSEAHVCPGHRRCEGRTLARRRRRKSFEKQIKYGGNKDGSRRVGKAIAERALAAGIKQVCFDRGSTSITAAWPRWPTPHEKQD